jgi:hypothetical protein
MIQVLTVIKLGLLLLLQRKAKMANQTAKRVLLWALVGGSFSRWR